MNVSELRPGTADGRSADSDGIMRLECLRQASVLLQHGRDPADVIKAAHEFYGFLTLPVGYVTIRKQD